MCSGLLASVSEAGPPEAGRALTSHLPPKNTLRSYRPPRSAGRLWDLAPEAFLRVEY